MFSVTKFFQRVFGSSSQDPTSARASSGLTLDDLAAEWLIIGLGNPGPRYAATRHNVGYLAIDELLADAGASLEPIRGVPATVAPITVGETPVLVVRSTTFMNLSGEAVAPLAQKLGIPAERVIVLHDELDLPTNKVRLKQGGNENGHNGLKSTTEHLGTRDYLRIRIGISRPPQGMPVSEYVLGPLDEDSDGVEKAISTAAEAARLIVSDGLSKAQNTIHSKR